MESSVVVECGKCERKNRIPDSRLDGRTNFRCGQCKELLRIAQGGSPDRPRLGLALHNGNQVMAWRAGSVLAGLTALLALFDGHYATAMALLVSALVLCWRSTTVAAALRAQSRREHWYEYTEPKLRNTPGYPGDWRLRRVAVFLRADGRCEACGTLAGALKTGRGSRSQAVAIQQAWHYEYVTVHGAHVHHKVEVSKRGSHALSNLELLCEDCHASKHPNNPLVTNFRENLERQRRRRSIYLGDGASVRRARRQWECYICQKPIIRGEEYFGGDYAKVCMKCKPAV